MKNTLSLLILLVFTNFMLSQNSSYSKLWKEVEQFEIEGLPKSALNIVNRINANAIKDHNTPEMIKAMLFKSNLTLVLEEDAQLKIINDFKDQIHKSKFPTKNILESILANMYWQYFNENRWRFYNRTKTSKKVNVLDFRTWDLEILFNEIHIHFQNSLKSGLMLQQEDLNNYNTLLNLQKDSKIYRPTLFDFLNHQALSFYKTKETNITKPAYKFEIDNPVFLADSETFSTLKITSKDSSSLQLNTLKIYQDLISFHLKDEKPSALVDVNIERLKFINKHATFSNKESILLEALNIECKKLNTNNISSLYNFEIASIYYQQSLKYNRTHTDNRWKAKDAMDLCNSVILKFPESKGTEKCQVLKAQIKQQALQITTEDILPIQKHGRLLIQYKNIDTLNFQIFKLSRKELERFNNTYRKDDQLKFSKKLNANKNWKSILKNEKDYQTHTTEVVIPKLNTGNYLVFSWVENDKDIFAFSTIQVTNLAVVETENDYSKIFQIIDRNNGKPIKNATVELSFYKNNNRSIQRERFTTNSYGEIKIEKGNDHYRNITAKIKYGNDIAYFGDYYINKFQKRQKNTIEYKSFVFTDRSIYRPGQTVYFKAITMETKKGTSEVLANKPVYAVLYNVNDEEVKELELTTNEFGSVSGEFILPKNGLNGTYYIEFDGDDEDLFTEHYFSVEDYKRPKFETKFKPVTKTFKVNDSVTVKGNALAFTGSNVTDAKVVYSVSRKVEYPGWYYWYRPSFYSEPQEIIHGESITNNNGEFEIIFKALPDQSVDKSSLPIFKYEITADVTDLNGETRSAKTIVNIGYHALVAKMTINNSVNNTIDKTKKGHTLSIATENLNNEFVSAKGVVKIYKLKAPNSLLRKRPWAAPDYQNFTEDTFKNLFPYDAYSDEQNPNNWKKGNLVFDKEFNTEITKQLKLGQLKKWQSGAYLITLESKDKFGQLVKDEIRTTLYNNDDRTLADNKLFNISTHKTAYKTGEMALITLASAAENINVTVKVEKDRKIIKTQIIELNNNKETISIPIQLEDIGGFSVHYSYAAFNSYQSGTLNISVSYPKTELDIETKTFRDKLQPGTDETWSFKIKGPQGEKVSAELLASMYDASLDQFKQHNWAFNPILNPVYNSSNRGNVYGSFGTKNFRVYDTRNSFNYKQNYYDQLNWFGFSLNFNKRQYDTYLKLLRLKTESKYDDSIKKGYVSGTIFDEQGNPLPGVSVIVKGTTRGTTTDFDGNFSIEVSDKEILVLSYIGFSTRQIRVNKNNLLNISLAEDISSLDKVVVTGYATQKRKANLSGSLSSVRAKSMEAKESDSLLLSGEVSGITITQDSDVSSREDLEIFIRGQANFSSSKKPLVLIDGVPGDIDNINFDDIENISVLKEASAKAIYGARAANGVILVTTKSGLKKLNQVKIRKNLNETAFFFPQLQTDAEGNISFSFTSPEALTQWNLQLLAHTKTLESATTRLTTVTQKELMVIPNAPRFLREGDAITISAKISNLTDKKLSGQAILLLTDAISGKKIDIKLNNIESIKPFSVDAKGNTHASWNLSIPHDVQAIQYKVIAKSEIFSDGEQNTLPILSNRKLVTETLPMWIRSNETKTFTLDKLKTNTSKTLKHHKLTLEITSNPAWYAVQALPYLMEYPYQCNEQTFSRYYANALASHIANSNPRIQDVFKQWASQDALISNLEKNEELKSILIQETPWLRDVQSETEQKKRIALLFDLNKINNELQSAINKLKNNQMPSGGWAWFNGGRENRYITQHIISGFGHLKQLEIKSKKNSRMIEKAINYLDKKFIKAYKDIRKYDAKVDLNKDHLSYTQLHYLYMRSFYPEIKKSKEVKDIMIYYQTQIQKYWLSRSLYSKGLMALIAHRNGNSKTALKIMKSLKETSITSDELGMYWKANTNSWHWYQAPIETQALMIETFFEIENNKETIDNLKFWLLKNKQTNKWKTTKATTEAIYALLLQGSDWLNVTDVVDVILGGQKLELSKPEDAQIESGTGYYKTSWNTTEIEPQMAEVQLTKKGDGIAWGSLYWQYFEDLDKIDQAETPLKIEKKLFLKTNTNTGEEISEINSKTNLKVGDLVSVRIELRSDRNMEFLHMKDMRAAGFEPLNINSKYKWQDGLGYYESTKDASTNFFFDYLPKGVYVFEYDLRINNAGNMSNGITTIQSMYAPEFSSHSEGTKINIE